MFFEEDVVIYPPGTKLIRAQSAALRSILWTEMALSDRRDTDQGLRRDDQVGSDRPVARS
jgi:hypothetical protein